MDTSPPTSALRSASADCPAITPEACAAVVIDVVPAAMRAMHHATRARVGDGLSVPQFRCLAYIDRHPETSLGDVAGFLGVSPASASAMVERLKQAGHVDDSVCAKDRRRSALRSSSSGRRMVASMRGATLAELARLLGQHSAQQLATLLQGMQLLKATFKP